jgi:inhibitor of cysteine peptidase
MLLRRALCLVGSVVFTAGCSRALPQASSAGQVLTEADSGRSLVLPVGARFEVRLPSRPGTGYTWGVTHVDPEVVAEQGPSSSQPVGRAQAGSAALEAIPFVARGPGATRLEIAYRRPWEKGAPPARTFTLDVTVQ